MSRSDIWPLVAGVGLGVLACLGAEVAITARLFAGAGKKWDALRKLGEIKRAMRKPAASDAVQ